MNGTSDQGREDLYEQWILFRALSREKAGRKKKKPTIILIIKKIIKYNSYRLFESCFCPYLHILLLFLAIFLQQRYYFLHSIGEENEAQDVK